MNSDTDVKIEQDRLLYERMKAGDDAARETLILGVEYLVHYFAHKYSNNNNELLDELTSEGYLAVVESIDKWEFRDKEFKIYASGNIKFSMFRYYERKINCIYNIDNNQLDSLDVIDSPLPNSLQLSRMDPGYDDVDYENVFDRVCNILTKTQRVAMTLLYKHNLGPAEIAKVMKKSKSSINSHLSDARTRLRENYTRKNLGID